MAPAGELGHNGVVKNVRDLARVAVPEDGGPDVHGTTRDRVARSLLHNGPSTASELAERLRLTPAAVRRHLDALLSTGMIGAREQRIYGARGRGRPAKVFALTDDPAMAQRVSGMIINHAGRLEELLRDLLDLSRLESPDAAIAFATTSTLMADSPAAVWRTAQR